MYTDLIPRLRFAARSPVNDSETTEVLELAADAVQHLSTAVHLLQRLTDNQKTMLDLRERQVSNLADALENLALSVSEPDPLFNPRSSSHPILGGPDRAA